MKGKAAKHERKRMPKSKSREAMNERLVAIMWFLLKFNILALPMYLLIYMNISMPLLQALVANAVHVLLGLLGYSSVVEGYTLKFSAGASIVAAEMTFDCIGWKSMYALLALAIATPRIEWKKKLKFLAIGLPSIFAINIIRIATTVAVVINLGISYLEFVHSILWQEGLIIAVATIWYLWLRRYMTAVRNKF